MNYDVLDAQSRGQPQADALVSVLREIRQTAAARLGSVAKTPYQRSLSVCRSCLLTGPWDDVILCSW